MFPIRPAKTSDLNEIMDLLRKNELYLGDFDERYSPDFRVAVDENGEIAGCIKHIITEKNIFRIKSLAVSEEHRRKSIATRLVLSKLQEAALKGFTKVYVGLLRKNDPSKSLFEKLGFHRIEQEEYKIFNECGRCMPSFVNKWPYCKRHSKEGECPKYFYKIGFYLPRL